MQYLSRHGFSLTIPDSEWMDVATLMSEASFYLETTMNFSPNITIQRLRFMGNLRQYIAAAKAAAAASRTEILNIRKFRLGKKTGVHIDKLPIIGALRLRSYLNVFRLKKNIYLMVEGIALTDQWDDVKERLIRGVESLTFSKSKKDGGGK